MRNYCGILFLSLWTFSAFTAEKTNEYDAIIDGFETTTPTVSNDEAIMNGFEEAPVIEQSVQEAEKNGIWSEVDLSMTIRASASHNYQRDSPAANQPNFQDLTRARIKFVPEADWKFADKWQAKINGSFYYDGAYRIKGRDQFTQETLDRHESEMEIREAYVLGSLTPNLDIKLGRQVVVWGKSDGVRVVDVLNPLDMREIGQVDIEDLRLPVAMAVANYYIDNWKLSVIMIPEIGVNRMPGYGSEYIPANLPKADDKVPNNSLENIEFAMSASAQFQGWDISFHAANYYADAFHLAINSSGKFQREYSRLTMLGVAGNAVFGSSVLKAEIAHVNGLEYFSTGNDSFQRIDAMIGLDYNGFTNTTITLEVLDQYLPAHKKVLEQAPDETGEHEVSISARYSQTFMREKLQLMALAGVFGKPLEDGAFYRAQLSYDVIDALTVTGGVLMFQSGDSVFWKSIASNDKVFAELSYSF